MIAKIFNEHSDPSPLVIYLYISNKYNLILF